MGTPFDTFGNMRCSFTLLLGILFSSVTTATLWTVGPGQTFTMPSQVAGQVQDGDTVDILAGTYPSDVTNWTANDLLLRGTGGFAHLESNGLSWGDKAIWVVQGDRTTIEWIAFSECTSTSNNGAGIRQEGHDLTVRHCWFHDNENGILAGTVNPSTITIEYSEFGYNGYGDGFSHNLYINHVDTLFFRFNYSHHAHVGHELKSRAHVNFILYNRIGNEATGEASREVDLPDGGEAYLIGNVVQQGLMGQNSNLVGFGVESLSNPGPHELYAINNTLVNEKVVGSFFAMPAAVDMFKAWSNILAGGGTFTNGTWPMGTDTLANLVMPVIADAEFVAPAAYDYHILYNSPARNHGNPAGVSPSGVDLAAYYEYRHPTDSILRCQHATLDAGAFEHCTTTGLARTDAPVCQIFPVPATDVLHVRVNDDGPELFFEVLDPTGRLMRRLRGTGGQQLTIPLEGLSAGAYLLRVPGPQWQLVRSFMKVP